MRAPIGTGPRVIVVSEGRRRLFPFNHTRKRHTFCPLRKGDDDDRTRKWKDEWEDGPRRRSEAVETAVSVDGRLGVVPSLLGLMPDAARLKLTSQPSPPHPSQPPRTDSRHCATHPKGGGQSRDGRPLFLFFLFSFAHHTHTHTHTHQPSTWTTCFRRSPTVGFLTPSTRRNRPKQPHFTSP